MDISIVIVSWNTCGLLSDCLASVERELARSGLRVETWVVDNASTDGTVQHLKRTFPWIRLIENASNVGFAAANNQALRQASGRYLLLLNSDTVLLEGALNHLVEFMNETPVAGAAGARLLNEDGSLQESCYPEPTLGREVWRLFHLDRIRPAGVYDMAVWDTTRPREVDSILGACMLLRREVVEDVGEMDESYFMYSEEIDWCLRIRRAGWEIYWVPQAKVVHLVGGSTRRMPVRMFLYLYRGKIRYFRKHHGSGAALVYKLILIVASLMRLALTPLVVFQPAVERRRKLTLAGQYARLLVNLVRY